MSVIVDVLREESERLFALVGLYERKIDELPKGSISIKPRGKQKYCYRAFWSEKKPRFEYVGREGSEKAEDLSKKIEMRRKYEAKKRASQSNLAEVEKLIRAAER